MRPATIPGSHLKSAKALLLALLIAAAAKSVVKKTEHAFQRGRRSKSVAMAKRPAWSATLLFTFSNPISTMADAHVTLCIR
eukprot:CAMPEP_0175761118 /NCGR_PEP_ID=MMETSP0097-20121207/66486_1 /TAXON_ID=311494 /ORGANISM="Alexandrium monilatum, Strain CCMP3105" /LENGTH=80 /DNA_ID=CAMNT_0017070665 /DNA_START=93 /DNA_END=335 /DNA_ORIENTATION=-